jgi:hypothetical protein
MAATSVLPPSVPAPIPAPPSLTRAQLLELYYYMILTRGLEERLAALHRQTTIRDDDCVLFLEPKYLYRRVRGDVPSGGGVV